jgi:uncharacterized Zn finger protein
MKFNPETNQIFCDKCNCWKDLYKDIINPTPTWECLHCGNVVAYDWDFIGIFFEEE